MDLKAAIRSIPDFPKKGIVFRDITTLLKDQKAFRQSLDRMETYCRERNAECIIGIESRGFIFGGALSDRLKLPFVPVRKAGKLPSEVIKYDYELEYGTDTIEIHSDALNPGQKIVVVDDLLATGGTMEATCHLIEKCGAVVAGIAVLISLDFLPWREKLDNYDILTLINYETE